MKTGHIGCLQVSQQISNMFLILHIDHLQISYVQYIKILFCKGTAQLIPQEGAMRLFLHHTWIGGVNTAMVCFFLPLFPSSSIFY